MKNILVLALILGLVVQALAQASPSGTSSNSNTPPISISNTNSNSNSVTESGSASGTPSGTYPQPPSPINLANDCQNHIINICPGWANPTGFTFNKFRLYYQAVGSATITRVVLTTTSTRITNLTPGTSYNVWVQGEDTTIRVFSANSTVVIMTTDPADPKEDPTLDITNFACNPAVNPVSNRGAISCTWTAANSAFPVVSLRFKVHCTSTIREPLTIRKNLWGSRAQVTSILFAVNRDQATCNVYVKAVYSRRPASRHHAQVILS